MNLPFGGDPRWNSLHETTLKNVSEVIGNMAIFGKQWHLTLNNVNLKHWHL